MGEAEESKEKTQEKKIGFFFLNVLIADVDTPRPASERGGVPLKDVFDDL